MKKFVIFTLISAMAAGAVFAADGVNINAWDRGVITPLVVQGSPQAAGKVLDKKAKAKTFVGSGATWGGDAVRVDFRIVGDSEFVGFGLNATAENGALAGNDDAAYIYAKPFGGDILKIKIGLFVEHELRGKIGTANNTFDRFVAPNYKDEDHIFTRFAAFGSNSWEVSNYNVGQAGGFIFTSKPVDGLFIGLMANGGGATPDTVNFPAYDAYNYMQVGAGYVLEGIGHVRAQWVGGYAGTYDASKLKDIKENYGTFNSANSGRVEAAFALTAVDGLLVDLGGRFYMPVTVKNTSTESKGIGVGLGAQFRMEAFAVAFRFDGDFASYKRGPKNDDSVNPGVIDIRLNPSYDLEPATVGVVFGLNSNVAGKGTDGKEVKDWKPTMTVGFGGYVQKGLGKGSIKAGATYMMAPTTDGKANGSSYFSIPIILEYAFF